MSDFGPTAENRVETLVWRDREIRVPPLELQLEVSKRRGLNERVEKTVKIMHSTCKTLSQNDSGGGLS